MRRFLLALFTTASALQANPPGTPHNTGDEVSTSGYNVAQPSSAPVLPRNVAEGQTALPGQPAAPSTIPTAPQAARDGVEVRWFGHGFIYLTSASGVRIALDPFEEDSVAYPFPPSLPADVVLITCEAADRSGGVRLAGNPQLFRSVTGLGTNRANGILFKGVETYRDERMGRDLGGNTVYVFEIDRVRFCYLGALGHRLTSRQISDIGRVDVLFLPAGNDRFKSADWLKMIEELRAKWIVPISYKTENTRPLDLRELKDLDFKNMPFVKANSSTFVFKRDQIPKDPTLLILQSP